LRFRFSYDSMEKFTPPVFITMKARARIGGMDTLVSHLPSELFGFVLTLAISLLIGLEREEHEPDGIGGIRTFPLIGLSGFLLTRAFPESPVPFALGLVVLGGLLALSHWSNVTKGEPGVTTEVAALMTFTLGASAAGHLFWLSIACGVVAVVLLQEKKRLERLAARLPRRELRILLRFLLLAGVILPIVPNRSFTALDIDPFDIWLVVVAVSGVSYASYLLRLWMGPHRGLFAAGILGGAYSSTVTTVVLAKSSSSEEQSNLGHIGAIVAATGVMYIRLWILVILFAPPVAHRLTPLFWTLGSVAILLGGSLSRLGKSRKTEDSPQRNLNGRSNPLEITAALTFAGIFAAVLIVTRVVASRFGEAGILVFAAIMGAADVDPFILGVSQTVGAGMGLGTGALAIVVAASTNNLMKGIYAVSFGNRTVGWWSLAILATLGIVSLLAFLLLS
jgi:uncharacterized membrane protein (DUF4010 family)